MDKNAIIRFRRGTASDWSNSQPQPGGQVLKLGEPGYEKDTGRLKIGDGSTPWNSLPYFNDGASIDPEALQDLIGSTGFLEAGNGITIQYNDNANKLIIGTAGLQQAGNYSVVGHNHAISDVNGLQSALDNKQAAGNYSVVGHDHAIGDVNGLQSALDNKQAAGNYSVVGHNHVVNDISDFNNTVTDIVDNTLNTSLIAGNGITLTYNNINDTLTITNSQPTYDAAVNWSANHTLVDGTRYLIGDLVYSNGNIYRAKAENESIPVTNTTYWENLGAGYRLNIDGRDIPNIPYPVTSVNGQTGSVTIPVGNPFDQNLNTTNNPNFNSVGITTVVNHGQNIATLGPPVAGGATDKIRLWDFQGTGSNFNYGIGAEGNHIWFSMDVNDGTGGYKFYSRNNTIFKIGDDGKLYFRDSTIQNTAWTGSVAISGVSGLQNALDSKASLVNGLVPSTQLPSYVDDVLEYSNLASFPISGEIGKIYVAQNNNKIYRWSGSSYIEISPSPGSTDSVPEGSVNLYFTNSRASAAAPVQSVAGKAGVVTLSKIDVGLNNVDNTSDTNKPVSTATQNALNNKSDIKTPVYSLGTLSGSNPIDFATDRPIQTLTLNGSAVTFTKGSGWPTDNSSVDVILRITVTTSTTVTWSIVTDWFNQSSSPLPAGTHLFLLRNIGSSIIEGHYIGSKTN